MLQAILIAGPTASGKSALAISLAQKLDGIVINADSMQVYRDLRIITARPSEADERRVPHALFGSVDGGTNYSVNLWLADVASTLADALTDGKIPIFAGGTGLYFKALTQGLSDIPHVPTAIRESIRAWASSRTPHELHAELALRDPETALRLRPTDPQRLTRALEVYEATGTSLTEFQAKRLTPLVNPDQAIAVALARDRTDLRERIETRLDAMIEGGALDEVRSLSRRRLDPALPIMRAHGVPSLLQHIRDSMDLNDAVTHAKAATRKYVKRQDTFMRNQLSAFRPVDPDRAEAAILAQLE